MPTFYASGIGSDMNNGTSPDTPWRHFPSMEGVTGVPAAYVPQPGDRFYFMDGEWIGAVANNAMIDVGWSGTEANPIQILVKDGCSATLDNRIRSSSLVWEQHSAQIWKTTFASFILQALWVDGESFRKVATLGEVGLGQAASVNNILYVGSGSDPTFMNMLIVGPGARGYVFRAVRGNIHVDGAGGLLEFKGGGYCIALFQQYNATIDMYNMKMRNVTMGWNKVGFSFDGGAGTTAALHNMEISNCVINSRQTAQASSLDTLLAGDGLIVNSAVDGALIENNTVTDFAHDQITVTTKYPTSGCYGVRNVIIRKNDASGPSRTYGRAIGVAGVSSNIHVIDNNFHDYPTRIQYAAKGGSFVGNIIKNCFGSVTSGVGSGQGIHIQTWDTGIGTSNASDLKILNNVIDTVEAEGIYITTSNDVSITGEMIIANNVVLNAGSYDMKVKQWGAGTISPLIIANNHFTGDSISDRDTIRTVAAANAGSEYRNNSAADPKLVNFAPTVDSPCLSSGLTVNYPSLAQDGRPFNTPPSIGAHETRQKFNRAQRVELL